MDRSDPCCITDLTCFHTVLPSKLPTDVPVLFLYGTKDPTCPPSAVQNMGKFTDQLKVVPISDVGHWIMVQASETVTEAVLEWLESTLGPKALTRL